VGLWCALYSFEQRTENYVFVLSDWTVREEWRSGRSGCKTCPWLAVIRLKRISSASSVRSLYVGTSHCSIIQVLHRLTNDSSLAWSAAEHAPDHLRCLCSLPAVDARRHPGRRGAFDVYSCHTCSLYGGVWIEMPALFVVAFCRRGPFFSRRVRLLLIIIAAGVSVSAETRKPIYCIRRYCKATSEYSPIRSIGLTLFVLDVGPDPPQSEKGGPFLNFGTFSYLWNSWS